MFIDFPIGFFPAFRGDGGLCSFSLGLRLGALRDPKNIAIVMEKDVILYLWPWKIIEKHGEDDDEQ